MSVFFSTARSFGFRARLLKKLLLAASVKSEELSKDVNTG